jgi:hypothetical protein
MQCRAKTLNGSQCSFKAKEDEKYCGKHTQYELPSVLEDIVDAYTDVETYKTLIEEEPEKYTEKKLRNNLIADIPTDMLERLNLANQLGNNYFKSTENSDAWDEIFQEFTADKINPKFLISIFFLYLSAGYTDVNGNDIFQEIIDRVTDQKNLIEMGKDKLYKEIKDSINEKDDIWSKKPKYYYKQIFDDVYFDLINNNENLYFTDILDEKLKKKIKDKFIKEINSGEKSLYEYQTGNEYNNDNDLDDRQFEEENESDNGEVYE